ncbi:polyketide synthase [Streptomyces sp. TRM 70361]|uniref:beta-ketoacyl [acyl carrier protein] synthase domain-containing protein n=1 Tax=Streptomyces sp. TRM 70361 TaxID=3116553 RepID=UPI002E7C1D07|nr:polyketide synthase [Streptomyces sp. TRM 70361]MEE1941359.1 polyketide synthase [Streptomyces sp. TRM 70361]
MPSDTPSGAQREHRPDQAPPEPIAIVGMSALYPGVRSPGDYWRLLNAGPPGEPGADSAAGSPGGLTDLRVDVARYGIPPAQAGAMARMQLLMLEAARRCLADAGHPGRPLPADRTDVVTGTCFGLDRQYANALRVEAGRYAREVAAAAGGAPWGAEAAERLRGLLVERAGGSSHDRVGEMASTIPARIAGAFKLRGRTLAVESADATSFLGVAHAVNCLRGGVSDAVLVVAGQRREGPLPELALAAKGLLAPGTRPFAADGRGFPLGEGVGAVLLKRLSSAVRDGDRIYAEIRGVALRHHARPGAFRYSDSVPLRRETAEASHREAAVPAGAVGYVECAGSGLARETAAELAALAGLHQGADGEPAGPAGRVVLGSVRDRLGHTFANAGLAALTKAALALYHRGLPPQWPPPDGGLPYGAPFRTLRTGEEWPRGRDGAPRCAAVHGASLTGTLCHLLLAEHEPDRAAPGGGTGGAPARTARAATGRTAAAAEPVAVVGVGGRFAGARDAGEFWRVVRSGRDRLGPVPESVLDRELYHAPGALSLTHSYTDRGGHVPVPEEPPAGLRITPLRHAAMDAAQRLALAVAGELLTGHRRAAGTLSGPGVVAVGSNLGLTAERRAAVDLALRDTEEALAALAGAAGLSPVEVRTLLKRVRERYGGPGDPLSPALLDGCLAGGTAALIANEYGLAAVPVAVEAACASSLAALDLAVGALRAGTADFAVAGGVELACNARDMVLCSALGLLSHGTNRPFDAAADGFTPGDGCGLFLLKRYADARRDGDEILGVLRGVGASNDARSLIAPDAAGQARAMRRAFEQVDFGPGEVDYLEAHGTGTRVGDRVEIDAVARVYGTPGRDPLRIGSAKSFFGHTFAAAGSAGLLRALQAIRARTIPPGANLRTLNPALDLAAVPATVPTEAARWPAGPGRPRRAGVSSFGTGGINYHLLVEEHTDGTR